MLLLILARNTHQLVDKLHHMHGNADRAGLIGNRPRNGLPDPPGRIRGKLEAARIVEPLDGFDETDIPFLHEVE